MAARRLQWDSLVWQVPLLSLTAQAFLFTIALSGDSRQTARIIACLLSLLVSFLCITLMARQRQAELADAEWLKDFEEQHWPDEIPVHGLTFQRQRRDLIREKGRPERWIRPIRGYRTWIIGQLAVATCALAVLVIAISHWDLLVKR